MKHKKKKRRIGGVALLTIFTLLLLAVCWQRSNVEALLLAHGHTQEELAENLETQRAETRAMLEEKYQLEVRDLTAEEERALLTGEMTSDQAMALITGGITTAGQAQQQTPAPADTAPAQTDTSSQANEIVNRYVGQMYGLKASYMGALSGVMGSARSEFYALPEEERTESAKQSILASYVGYASGLEGQCDGEVSAVLAGMESELSAIGADTSVVGQVRSAYYAEKSAQRAYYLSYLG